MVDIPSTVQWILNSILYANQSDLNPVFTVSNIVIFLAYIVSASTVFLFLWCAVRKAFRAIIQATTRGRGKIC